jgi:hypothetical protein
MKTTKISYICQITWENFVLKWCTRVHQGLASPLPISHLHNQANANLNSTGKASNVSHFCVNRSSQTDETKLGLPIYDSTIHQPKFVKFIHSYIFLELCWNNICWHLLYFSCLKIFTDPGLIQYFRYSRNSMLSLHVADTLFLHVADLLLVVVDWMEHAWCCSSHL